MSTSVTVYLIGPSGEQLLRQPITLKLMEPIRTQGPFAVLMVDNSVSLDGLRVSVDVGKAERICRKLPPEADGATGGF